MTKTSIFSSIRSHEVLNWAANYVQTVSVVCPRVRDAETQNLKDFAKSLIIVWAILLTANLPPRLIKVVLFIPTTFAKIQLSFF